MISNVGSVDVRLKELIEKYGEVPKGYDVDLSITSRYKPFFERFPDICPNNLQFANA